MDDDAYFLRSLARLLRASGYDPKCYASAAEFLEERPAGAPGCVVTDLKMPGMDGLALQEMLVESGEPLPVVFLTGHGDVPDSVKAMRLGAEDFLLKTSPREELLAGIERALARDARERKDREHRRELLARFESLTTRERQVLVQVLSGRLNKQIAHEFGIDERSVKRHRTSLMAKIKVRSVAELAQLAAEAGMTETGV